MSSLPCQIYIMGPQYSMHTLFIQEIARASVNQEEAADVLERSVRRKFVRDKPLDFFAGGDFANKIFLLVHLCLLRIRRSSL